MKYKLWNKRLKVYRMEDTHYVYEDHILRLRNAPPSWNRYADHPKVWDTLEEAITEANGLVADGVNPKDMEIQEIPNLYTQVKIVRYKG